MRIEKHKNEAICELLVEHNLSAESQSTLERSQYRTQDKDTGTEAAGGQWAVSYQILGASFSIVEVPTALGKAAQQHLDEALVPGDCHGEEAFLQA